jgi:hypothetical protein
MNGVATSLMSDSKWRKFFRVVADYSADVWAANWKLLDEREPIPGHLPTTSDVWESAVDGCLNGPVTYSSIEWIDLPKSISYRPYANGPVKERRQVLDAFRRALDAIGQFPIEETEEGLRIYGYHRNAA